MQITFNVKSQEDLHSYSFVFCIPNAFFKYVNK